MKIIITVASSRSGHEFFHSLLDGHSQILQFPAHLIANKNYSIDVEKYILNYWLSQLGYPTTINVVDEISLTKSKS